MRIATRFALLAAMLAFATPVQAATVESQSAWVSANGDDGNVVSGCVITAPCQTLFEIASGPEEGVGSMQETIPPEMVTESAATSEGVTFGDGVSPGGRDGIDIITAGIEVTLRGLVVYGIHLISTPPIGINISAAAVVRLEQCKISGFRETSRFPYKERPHMPSSPTTPGRASTSVDEQRAYTCCAGPHRGGEEP